MEYTKLEFIVTPKETKQLKDGVLYKCEVPNGDYASTCYILESKNKKGELIQTLGHMEGESIEYCNFSFLAEKSVSIPYINRESIVTIPCHYSEILPGKDMLSWIIPCQTTDGINTYNFAVEAEEFEDDWEVLYTIGELVNGLFINTSSVVFPNWRCEDQKGNFFCKMFGI